MEACRRLVLIYFPLIQLCCFSSGTHFRGGTISWKTNGADKNNVVFHFLTGWEYGRGGCDVTPLGHYATVLNSEKWLCTRGCSTLPVIVGDNSYYCTGLSLADRWEQGEKRFSFRFPGPGIYTVSYSGRTWMPLSYGKSGDWNLETKLDLRSRSDTGSPNASPVVATLPVYKFQLGCHATLRLPVYDENGDDVRCRWSNGTECGSLCSTSPMLPGATLDQAACSLTIDLTSTNGYANGNTYALAITVEDFPSSAITLSGTPHGISTPLSFIPLQFVFEIEQAPNGCINAPEFIDSPPDGSTFIVPTDYPWALDLYLQGKGGNLPSSLQVSGPRNIAAKQLVQDPQGRQLVKMATLSWQPSAALKGVNILCLVGIDINGLRSDQLCYTLLAGALDPCDSDPCQNGGLCSIRFDTFTCTCPAGVTGATCESDIDECLSKPCQNGGTCANSLGSYTCFCQDGFNGKVCADVNHCANHPCGGRGKCTSVGTGYTCACSKGFTGRNCNRDEDDCASSPCLNGGLCRDTVGDFYCQCPPQYSGKRCEVAVDLCALKPCKNGGSCTSHGDSYSCSCATGFTGLNCELSKSQTCSGDESYCTCMTDGKPARVPIPAAKHDNSLTRDLTAGIIGYPIGLLIGVGSCALYHFLIREKICKSKTGPQRRPGSTSSTESLTSRTPSPLTPINVDPKVHNIYRSGFHDDQLFKTSEKMNINNYIQEKRDWNC